MLGVPLPVGQEREEIGGDWALTVEEGLAGSDHSKGLWVRGASPARGPAHTPPWVDTATFWLFVDPLPHPIPRTFS